MAGDAVLRRHPEPLVVPVGGADVLGADADRVLRRVVDRPVEQMVVAERDDDVGPGGDEPLAHLGRGPQRAPEEHQKHALRATAEMRERLIAARASGSWPWRRRSAPSLSA